MKNDQSIEELRVQFHDLSKEIYSLKNELAKSRKIEKPHLVREKKRERARVMTAISSKGGTV